jgi:tight adherence protein B
MLLVSLIAFALIVFLITTLAGAIAWFAFLKRQSELREAREGELPPGEEQEPGDSESVLIRQDRLSTLTFWDSLLAHFDFVEILQTRLNQAELGWSVGRVTIAMLLLGTVGFLGLSRFLPFLGSLFAASILGMAPYAYILRKRTQRFDKFREAFPDVLDSIARAMRAGFPLSPAMETVIAEAPAVVASELRRASTEANLGVGWQGALDNLSERVPLLEVNLFTAAVQLHTRTGGKLGEVLASLAENMRETGALRGEVRALSAHGKLTGLILTLLPLGIAGMMMYVSPSYMIVLWQHPMGKDLIAAAVGCLILAHFVIGKIVDIEI